MAFRNMMRICAALILLNGIAQAKTMILQNSADYDGAQDTSLMQNYPDLAGGRQQTLDVGGWVGKAGETRIRSLIRFELPDIEKTKILEAELTLKLKQFNGDAFKNTTVHLYRISAANSRWIQGSTAQKQANSATWGYHAYNHKPWAGSPGLATPDKDYIPEPVASIQISSDDTPGKTYTFQFRNLAFLQEWADQPASNTGFVLIAGSLETGRNQWISFHSSDSASPADRPALKIRTAGQDAASAAITVPLQLAESGYVTLVIEDQNGNRIRNLISETFFAAGKHQVPWDGLDDVGRVQLSIYNEHAVAGKMVEPGRYRVRGLVRPEIKLKYAMSPYTAGSPPWPVADGSGEWLANHTSPTAILYIPDGQAPDRTGHPAPGGQLLVASPVAEGGSGVAWLNLQGKKIYGQMWIGGVWTGATHLACDAGPKAVRGVYAYAASAFPGGGYDGKKPELRLAELLQSEARGNAPRDKRMGKGDDRPLLSPRDPYSGLLPSGKNQLPTPPQDERYAFPDNERTAVSGLAVHNAQMAVSLPKMNQLLWVDADKRRIVGTSELADPRGLAFDGQGRLLALSGTKLLRYTLANPVHQLHEPEVILSSGLEDPQQITTDSLGNIYISDWGDSHQIKVFSPSGGLLRAIGDAGKPTAMGPYNPRQMRHPNGLTITPGGELWVAETDTFPKRLSVWKTSGEYVRALFGPPTYGGGGTLDAQDKNIFYYNGMEFKLDWATRQSTLTSVFYRDDANPLEMSASFGFASQSPLVSFYADGVRYLTDSYTVHPTNGITLSSIWQIRDGVAVPVALAGQASHWPMLQKPEFSGRIPEGVQLKVEEGQSNAIVIWSDRNGDGLPQPDECDLMKTSKPYNCSVTVMPDLSFVFANLDGAAVTFRPESKTASGVPIYDINRPTVLAKGTRNPTTSGGGQAIVGRDGALVLTVPPEPFGRQSSMFGMRDGKNKWTYPSLWPGLHPSQRAPQPAHPGQLIGTTRLVGPPFTPKGSDAGEMWAINGNKGNIYVFTMDGLFVSTLFKDCRSASFGNGEPDEFGHPVDHWSLGEECFFTTLNQTGDGSIYVVGGPSSLIEVVGLEKTRRLPDADINVTEETLAQARQDALQKELARQKQRQARQQPFSITILPDAFAVDSKCAHWPAQSWSPIDASTDAAVMIGGDTLHAALRSTTPDLLANSGQSPQTLFKTGGGFDLMLGSAGRQSPDQKTLMAGDVRLVVSQVKGRVMAMLYEQISATPAAAPIPFSSPQRTVQMARVTDVSDHVRLAIGRGKRPSDQADQTTYEISVPLSVIGWQNMKAGDQVLGDIGFLRGNGFATLQRVYWANKASGLTSDLPTEAELTPQFWGTWRIGIR